jgi:hypothetical protein
MDRRPRRLPAAVLAAGALALASCSSPAAARPDAPQVPAIGLATSFLAGSSSWAVLPMGNLGRELDTFWQVVVANGNGTYRLVTPPGIADNGGIVVGSATARSVVLGFLTSVLLGFSPLALTDSDGRSWSPAVLPRALAHVPEPLASPGGTGRALALVGRDGADVMTAPSLSATWHTAATLGQLQKLPGGSCLRALTAVASVGPGGSAQLLGGTCGGGHLGLFADTGAGWHRVLPALVANRRATTEVAAIEPEPAAAGSDAVVLFVSSTPHGRALESLAIEVSGNGTTTAPGAPHALALGESERIESLGQVAGGGVYALLASGSDASPRDERLEVLSPGARAWREAAAPPDGTQDVVVGSGRVQALAVDGSMLTVFDLTAARAWQRAQVLHVPIEYGSSG